ncbi:MAG TPA: hypothetical protein VFM05_04615 [Candidatus Saccharimonadales bacterium]|nr:hypothetical protein [Candidatus Saccharimonadales bacterium]
MNFFRRVLPLAMALFVLLASSPTPRRSAKAVASSTKILYIIRNPENFSNEINGQLLVNSYTKFEEAFNEKGRVRTPYDGEKYDTCGPNEACDRIVIQRYEQLITVTIICNKYTETDQLPTGEITNIDEILGLLLQITIVVGTHDGQQHQ